MGNDTFFSKDIDTTDADFVNVLTENRRNVGNKIRYYRELKRYSQEELGFIAGLHRTYIGGVERGERNISLDNLYRITIALGVGITDLFTTFPVAE